MTEDHDREAGNLPPGGASNHEEEVKVISLSIIFLLLHIFIPRLRSVHPGILSLHTINYHQSLDGVHHQMEERTPLVVFNGEELKANEKDNETNVEVRPRTRSIR